MQTIPRKLIPFSMLSALEQKRHVLLRKLLPHAILVMLRVPLFLRSSSTASCMCCVALGQFRKLNLSPKSAVHNSMSTARMIGRDTALGRSKSVSSWTTWMINYIVLSNIKLSANPILNMTSKSVWFCWHMVMPFPISLSMVRHLTLDIPYAPPYEWNSKGQWL